ncbi:MAG: hypothetical protein R3C11_24155 [Planctomycetaceae bacterium]
MCSISIETFWIEQTLLEPRAVKLIEGSFDSFRSVTKSLPLAIAGHCDSGPGGECLAGIDFCCRCRSYLRGYEYYYLFVIIRLVVLSVILATLLAYSRMTHSQLRGVEFLFFGFVVLMWICQRYVLILSALEVSTEADLLTNRFNGMMSLVFIIFSFRMLIPHRWQETAKVVGTMARPLYSDVADPPVSS